MHTGQGHLFQWVRSGSLDNLRKGSCDGENFAPVAQNYGPSDGEGAGPEDPRPASENALVLSKMDWIEGSTTLRWRLKIGKKKGTNLGRVLC